MVPPDGGMCHFERSDAYMDVGGRQRLELVVEKSAVGVQILRLCSGQAP